MRPTVVAFRTLQKLADTATSVIRWPMGVWMLDLQYLQLWKVAGLRLVSYAKPEGDMLLNVVGPGS